MLKQATLFLCGLLAGLIVAVAGSNHAQSRLSLDAGYSDCRATPAPDGQWVQLDQPHDGSRYKAGCGTAGLSFKVNDSWTLGVHYVSLGRVETHAFAVTMPGDDLLYRNASLDSRRAECQPAFNENNCAYSWDTGSFTRGVNFSASRKLLNIGDVRIEGKGGLYVHKLSNHAVVTPIGCRDSCAWQINIDQSAERVSPMWGAVARWKYFYASWEFYERIGEHTPVTANIKGRTEVKTIGFSIPL